MLNIDKDPKEFWKPKEVADFKNEVIYGRFEKDVLPTIQRLNKYIGFNVRGHWHYQFLNDKGIGMLQEFIFQATEEMKISATYYEFRIRMYNKYNVPYQLELGV